jgi:hypothetical protein
MLRSKSVTLNSKNPLIFWIIEIFVVEIRPRGPHLASAFSYLLPFFGLYMLDNGLCLILPWKDNGDLKHFVCLCYEVRKVIAASRL